MLASPDPARGEQSADPPPLHHHSQQYLIGGCGAGEIKISRLPANVWQDIAGFRILEVIECAKYTE